MTEFSFFGWTNSWITSFVSNVRICMKHPNWTAYMFVLFYLLKKIMWHAKMILIFNWKSVSTPKKWKYFCAYSNGSLTQLTLQSIKAPNVLTQFNSIHLTLILHMTKAWIMVSLIAITIQISLSNPAVSLPACCHRLWCTRSQQAHI